MTKNNNNTSTTTTTSTNTILLLLSNSSISSTIIKRRRQQKVALSLVILLLWGTISIAFSTTSPRNNYKTMEHHHSTTSRKQQQRTTTTTTIFNSNDNNNEHIVDNNSNNNNIGKLEELKQREAELAAQLAIIRKEKLNVLRSRPLTIGIIGFGRFGQFIAKTFTKYGKVIVTSRTDYTNIANNIGAKYIPLSNPTAFLAEELDVIVVAVSILSFESTIEKFVLHLKKYIQDKKDIQHYDSPTVGPLIVDVLSVKEHARDVMLKHLPIECDILCTHPMFGPDSGKDGWYNLNFVYEKTRINKLLLDPSPKKRLHENEHRHSYASVNQNDTLVVVNDETSLHSVHEDTDAHVEGIDRMERFLSIWEEEGCKMVQLSCKDHDTYAANSQFITHLVGRVLGSQGLTETPIDTSGFQSVLKLIDSTTADSFDLFYGLYKYNLQNSVSIIQQLQSAMDDVVTNLKLKENEEEMYKKQKQQQQEENESSTNNNSNNVVVEGNDSSSRTATPS